jgi:hypothetical protein
MSNNNTVNFSISTVDSSKLPAPSFVKNLVVEGYLCSNVKAGEAVLVGSVLRQSPVANKTVLLADGAADIRVIGVATKATPLGEQGCMAVGGEFLVLVNKTVVAGDFLAVSAVAGVAESTGNAGTVGDFAIATTAGVYVGPQNILVSARFKKSELV